jgi:hypothetical protein
MTASLSVEEREIALSSRYEREATRCVERTETRQNGPAFPQVEMAWRWRAEPGVARLAGDRSLTAGLDAACPRLQFARTRTSPAAPPVVHTTTAVEPKRRDGPVACDRVRVRPF